MRTAHPFRRASYAGLVAAVAAACAHAAPAPIPAPVSTAPVLLRLHAQVGQTRRYRQEMANYMHLGPGEPPSGDSARPMSHLTENITETVTAVSGDTFTVAMVTDSVRMEMPSLPVSPEMFRGLDTMRRGVTITMKMDSRGRILSVETKGSAQLEERIASVRRMVGAFDTLGRGQAGYWRLPDRPVRVGDVWSDTVSVGGAQAGGPRVVVATFRLERIELKGAGRVALISTDVTSPPMAIGEPMRMTVGSMHVVGQFELDLESGWIVRTSQTMAGSVQTAMGDVSMRMVWRQVPLEERP